MKNKKIVTAIIIILIIAIISTLVFVLTQRSRISSINSRFPQTAQLTANSSIEAGELREGNSPDIRENNTRYLQSVIDQISENGRWRCSSSSRKILFCLSRQSTKWI